MKRNRILLVDDDPSFRALAGRLLRKNRIEEYEITEVEDARSAIAATTQDSFDCVLIDYRLPDMSGVDLICSLRINLGQVVPAILLSAESSEELLAHTKNLERLAYLPKCDVSRMALHQAIQNIIGTPKSPQHAGAQTLCPKRTTNHAG
jgi:CheY-like chemotaxis protein